MKIPLQSTYFDKKEEKAVASVLRSGWVTQGPRVAEFENIVKSYVGAKYAVATTSATTALFLSLKALGVGKGDEVLVPSFSFIATTNVVVHVGATPVFVDIDPKSYNINTDLIDKLITSKTKAIIPVDQVGLPCDLDKVYKIAKIYKLHVIEDAACGLGSKYKDKMIGGRGESVCFSFHPRKIITTGEGGMITTNSKAHADNLRMLRHHGMSVSDVVRHESNKITREAYPIVGYNFRMSDIQAAIGIEQMKKIQKILAKRAYLASRYTKRFSESKWIAPPYAPKDCTPNWQSYIIRLRPNKNVSRDNLRQKLLDAGIATQIGIMSAHLEMPYRKMYKDLYLPETESATKETITLPLYFQMAKDEQDYVIDKVIEFTEE